MSVAVDLCVQKSDLDNFIDAWDAEYLEKINQIDLFNASLTSKWSAPQKELFVRTFYHVRGHFHDFLWLLGNHATDKEQKDMILQNVAEELNGSARSHEQMYMDFAESLDVDLDEEIVEEKTYLPFVRTYNKDHLRWLKSNPSLKRFAAFSAYERLDNIDYGSLLNLVESFGTPRKGLIFFKVHHKAQHFDTTEGYLGLLYKENPEAVKESFTFIAEHQLAMWKQLSDVIFGVSSKE